MDYRVVMAADLGPSTALEEQVLATVGARLVKATCTTEELVIENCRDADAVLVGVAQPFTRRAIQAMQKCRVLSRLGIGVDNIDVAAATERGIPVSIIPDYCVPEVSDHAVALLLAFARGIMPMSLATREGVWREGLAPMKGRMHRLATQTLGLVGMGRIGESVAKKALAFGLRIVVFDPYMSDAKAKEVGVELVDFDRLLRESDFVSLHAPLTAETKHIFNMAAFERMKPTAYLINCARGGLIDEGALVTALRQGYIAGAGLDVTDPEPPDPNSPLFHLGNVLVTPHASFYSVESDEELRRSAAEAVVDVLKGGWPRVLANPEVRQIARG
jgi:D-3-phosphoglycerate dehydrogenase / 2-oxoglutarate reductase